LQQRFAERGGGCACRRDRGDFEFEDQQSDGDGEDAVTEGFEAPVSFSPWVSICGCMEKELKTG
jgi:hypothetical protein